MKKIIMGILLVFGMIALGSCGNNEETDVLYISSTSEEYYLDKKSESNYQLVFSINEAKSKLEHNDSSEIVYYISGTNEAEAVLVKDKFTAIKEGTVKVKAKINNLESTNSISINVCFSDTYKTKTESEIATKIEELSKSPIDFGAIKNIGIPKEFASMYSLKGIDEVMFINEDGMLEVCGIAKATKVELYSEISGKNVWEGKLASTFGTILATSVKNELIKKNIIPNSASTITKTMLENVTELSLAGNIVNDVTSIDGLKWLPNLETLDLSNNGIDNIEFASAAANLKKLIVNNNNISNLEALHNHEDITYLDISNNALTNLNYLYQLDKLTYLNISDNYIEDIASVSNLSELEALHLNNNKLKEFKDALAGLSYLKELGIGNCGLNFTQIMSIKFMDRSKIEYLDISGTYPNLNNLTNFRNLKTLILQDCSLCDGADISTLNNMTALQYLDISNNGLTNANLNILDGSSISFKLKASSLRNLNTLCLGSNEMTTIPDLKEFVYLETLDLTNSYNLQSLDSLGVLNIKELILDECNSIKIKDDGTDYLNAIGKTNLPKLEKLSIQSGLNYMTRDLYNKLCNKVTEGELKLRFLKNEYLDNTTIYNYSSSVYFSMEEFLAGATYTEDDKLIISAYTDGLILSLVNDASSKALGHYYFYIPSGLKEFSIYGNEYKTYQIGFNIQDRKQSSITFNFISFKDVISTGESVMWAEAGSRINIYTSNKCEFLCNNKTATLDVYDISIKVKNGELKIENTSVADEGSYGKYGGEGHKGAAGIRCNSAKINGKAKINAGKGGKGGYGKGEFVFGGDCSGYGGKGGTGGTAVEYRKTCSLDSLVTLTGGEGGDGGDAESWAAAAVYPGSNGNTGNQTERIS